MEELRERELEKEILQAENKYKCKYFFVFELLYLGVGMFLVYKVLDFYLKYIDSPFSVGLLLEDRFIFRFLPLCFGVYFLYEFLLIKIGYFWYLKQAVDYRCTFLAESYEYSFYEKKLYKNNAVLLITGIYYIALQFGIDRYFNQEEFVKPVVVAMFAAILEYFLITRPLEKRFLVRMQDGTQSPYNEEVYFENIDVGDSNFEEKDRWF